MTRNEHIIYTAGLFDGEGCITFGSNGGHQRFVLAVQLAMTTPYGPYLMSELFGGKVHLRAQATKNPKHRPRFIWQLRCEKAAAVLRELLPYLREKQEQAVVALQTREIQAGKGKANHDPIIREQLESFRTRLAALKRVDYPLQ